MFALRSFGPLLARVARTLLLAPVLFVAGHAAQANTTRSGHAFTPPDGFVVHKAGPLITFTAPEGDASVTVADLAKAKDADDAVVQAWKLAEPDFRRKLQTSTARPPRNGWVDNKMFTYETSPGEQRSVYAVARRPERGAPGNWVVIIIQGANATLEKRTGPISKFASSLVPKGHNRENFSGVTPKPLTPERIEQLKAFVAEGMKQLGVPGVGLSFIDKGKTVWAGGLGTRVLGQAAPVDANTRFMAGSTTKAMTSALQARAVDAGKLRWDQLVTEAFPTFQVGDESLMKKLQIRHLTCACTGMPRQDAQFMFTDPLSPAKIVFHQLAQAKPTSQFGEVFQYSNSMVAAAGYIAAAALQPTLELGQAYDLAMAQELFKPLGMTRTTFDFAEALDDDNHAAAHGDAMDGIGRVNAGVHRTVLPFRPAGGVWTTPRDFSRWVEMELARGHAADGRRVLSEANWAERYKPQITVGDHAGYGMSILVDRQLGVAVASHGGDISGYHADMFWLPDHGIGATILTNAEAGALLRAPLQRKLLELLFDGKPQADEQLRLAIENHKTETASFFKELTLPAANDATMPQEKNTVQRLAAAYRNDTLGTVRVERERGRVRFAIGHLSSAMAMRHNQDGSQSLVSTDPGMGGVDFHFDETDSPPSLVLREAQHVYRFTPQRR